MLKIEEFNRKTFTVKAVRVVPENIAEVTDWCDGRLTATPQGDAYIQVSVFRPMYPRQSRAFCGDWVLESNGNFKVYTQAAFEASFERTNLKKVDLHEPAEG